MGQKKNKIVALSRYLDIEISKAQELIDEGSYRVLTDREADSAASADSKLGRTI